MTERPLACTRCGSPAAVVEDVTGYLDWGPAVIGDDGTVRPADPTWSPPVLMADNAEPTGRPRACCSNRACGHQWRLRRRFTAA
ncbi:hypothetical protein [Streptomyces sp. NPDC059538]|uniref:hypothetical protein n=1 Tax=Streptomyces sp. NPDC059538 TaxID=3346860 RepID=UPI0036A09EE3